MHTLTHLVDEGQALGNTLGVAGLHVSLCQGQHAVYVVHAYVSDELADGLVCPVRGVVVRPHVVEYHLSHLLLHFRGQGQAVHDLHGLLLPLDLMPDKMDDVVLFRAGVRLGDVVQDGSQFVDPVTFDIAQGFEHVRGNVVRMMLRRLGHTFGGRELRDDHGQQIHIIHHLDPTIGVVGLEHVGEQLTYNLVGRFRRLQVRRRVHRGPVRGRVYLESGLGVKFYKAQKPGRILDVSLLRVSQVR